MDGIVRQIINLSFDAHSTGEGPDPEAVQPLVEEARLGERPPPDRGSRHRGGRRLPDEAAQVAQRDGLVPRRRQHRRHLRRAGKYRPDPFTILTKNHSLSLSCLKRMVFLSGPITYSEW